MKKKASKSLPFKHEVNQKQKKIKKGIICKYPKNSGITLIALAITIIIMLILAGVSLNATIGENGIILQAMYSKFATEIKTIEEKIQMKQAIRNSIYSGSINDLLEENNKYNDKLLIEDNELKYISSTVSSLELKWFEQLGLRKSSDYFTIEFDSANGKKIPNQTIRAGKQAKKPQSPTKSGYEFMGWYYLKESGTEEEPTYEEIEFNFNTKIVDNYQLYAKYAGEAVMDAQKTDFAFWQEEYLTNISSIIFTRDSTLIPISFEESWNIKANNYCADIMAYLENDNTGNSTYKLTIYSPYTIYCNVSANNYFYNFSSLSSIDFDNFDTSKVNTMRRMFSNCTNLQFLDLQNFDTHNVTSMYNMFSNCTNLKTINVNNFNVGKVTNFYETFQYCENLLSLDLSNFITTKANSMRRMFKNCHSLSILKISNFQTSNVESMESMFYNCSSLEEIDLSSFDSSNAKDMSCLFYGCRNLKSLDISNFDTNNTTSMNSMFRVCTSLNIIYVGKKWTTENVNTDDMFTKCKIQQVTLKQ